MRGNLSRRQWELLDRLYPVLEAWLHRRYSVLWVTLTSAPDSPPVAESWRKLERRIARRFAKPFYIAIETTEGFGVLHMFMAFPRKNAKAPPLFIPVEWLREQWQDIHGAWNLDIQRVGGRGDDAAKLARYAVAQYAAGQSAYKRCMASQDLGLACRVSPLAKSVRSLLRDMEWPLSWKVTFKDRRRVLADLLKGGVSVYKNRQIVLDNGEAVRL